VCFFFGCASSSDMLHFYRIGDCHQCKLCQANLTKTNVTPTAREMYKEEASAHQTAVRFIRAAKNDKMRRGAACARGAGVLHIGKLEQFGSAGVWGSGENDGAAQWYTEIPSDDTNTGKHRVPSDEISFKAVVRVIHGFTIMVTLTPPWVCRTGNADFGCTMILETFLGLEKLWGRLPKRW
jgi:hypothetical protein